MILSGEFQIIVVSERSGIYVAVSMSVPEGFIEHWLSVLITTLSVTSSVLH